MSVIEELSDLREELEKQKQTLDEFEIKLNERNRQRVQFFEENKDSLTSEETESFKETLNHTIDVLKQNEKGNTVLDLPDTEIETLRQYRSQLSQKAYNLIGIDAPTM